MEGAWFSNACSLALCRPTFATILLKMLSIQSCQPFQAQEAVTAVQLWLGRWDRRWVSPAQLRQLRNEDGDEGGQVPLPREAPHLPCLSCLEYLGWGASLKLFQLVLQVSVQVPLPPRSPLWDSQPEVWSHPPPHICPVGPHGPELPLYTPTTVIS